MRRSVREASLGFCLLVAIASGLGLWFWLKGISLGRQTWTMEASFQDAAGLAPARPSPTAASWWAAFRPSKSPIRRWWPN